MFKKNKNQLLSAYVNEEARIVMDIISGQRKRRRQMWLKLANRITWIVVVAVMVLFLDLLFLLPAGRELYIKANVAKESSEKLNTAWSGRKVNEIQPAAARVVQDLTEVFTALNKIKYNPAAWLPYVRRRVLDVDRVVGATYLSASAINNLAIGAKPLFRLMPDSPSLNFNAMSDQDKRELLAAILAGRELLPNAKSDFTEARHRLAAVERPDIFWRFGLETTILDQHLAKLETWLDSAESLTLLLPAIAGYPKNANYLFILQNEDELRPTGGFIGTYGLGVVEAGTVKRLDTHDIYHLDLPVKDKLKVEPPTPIKKYLGQQNWYMRDANWSPDWPTTAQKLLWFYREENRLQDKPESLTDFDFIVGLTPKVIIDLIKLTGPIVVREQVYTPENFVELLQVNTEKDFANFGFSRFDRKLIVGEITTELQKRLMTDLNKYWQPVLESLQTNLQNKDLLIWSKDEVISKYLIEHNWRGEIMKTASDYLLVVDANMGALKTDAVMKRGLNYKLEETSDGLTAKVIINYAHRGGTDWKTKTYRSFTRIFVPKGSELLKVTGFFGSEAEVITGEENGQTWFGAFIQIEPGKIGDLSFEYKLPYSVYIRLLNKGYSLLLQKQPGKTVDDLRIDLSFKKPINGHEPANLSAVKQGSRVYWRGYQEGDQFYEVTF
ncbi:hypothetical protein COT94_01305 [Candidatus Falkowbacteria bacterium CG10_big_fil_rev_8_21_14_0_10_37_14]|uniref:DUF4012 domain-containing protein n=1 Tax=Candidatus Falkowbacteria bacterium CG10_big_fil_rev_8_21_14_0_10_37_14 TaxID=1974561 RepID=A0A2M6WU36_9BACT|nr:DUF4012 domain-containing protein [Candidatus Falkowbacteria bacterium]PIT96312.1 MAG: hypothetical protein COT94_01305 [Candidatus Falkowbacteria bacterium CG10_big_fil_rev_8_21_14_0_10_37_14]